MTSADKEEIDSLLRREKERLADLPYFAGVPGDLDHGVLLSDRIEHYCGPDSKLISPFCREFLRPAGYDLRVGNNYAMSGKPYTLNDGGVLTIDPYQVAVIQTLETLNLPDFLIGRWNIRVGLAYRGLLWVGGAQVDPGFRGRLSCPIYNLSTEPVTLKHGEELAMIDFVVTTPVKSDSIAFQWWRRKIVFQQYNIALQSGVAHRLGKMDEKIDRADKKTSERLQEAAGGTSQRFESIQSRIDTFMTLAFTVVAVLFAGLGIIATKGSDDPSFVSSPVWVAVVALYFALRPYVVAFERNREDRKQTHRTTEAQAKQQDTSTEKWYTLLLPRPLEVVIASMIVFASFGFHIWHAHVSALEVRQAKEQASRAISALNQEKKIVETEIQLRRQSDERLESLQQQVNILLQTQATKK
ncbi:MAG: hypothetical protein ABSH47_22445 [Bryobacteraceae bacterium]|jgi:deoxycytidine triphosphate deaminase